MIYPNDADGDALRKLAEQSDMSKPRSIDFAVDVPDRASGDQVAAAATKRGYATAVECDEPTQTWTCYCTKQMLPAYDGVVAAQTELDELAKPFGGRSDGWGTFGNE
ncbi:MAG: ribonuclease E inhibitor RraB [Polyangiaceae bacterium]